MNETYIKIVLALSLSMGAETRTDPVPPKPAPVFDCDCPESCRCPGTRGGTCDCGTQRKSGACSGRCECGCNNGASCRCGDDGAAEPQRTEDRGQPIQDTPVQQFIGFTPRTYYYPPTPVYRVVRTYQPQPVYVQPAKQTFRPQVPVQRVPRVECGPTGCRVVR